MRTLLALVAVVLTISPSLAQDFASLPAPPQNPFTAQENVIAPQPRTFLDEGTFVPYGNQPFQGPPAMQGPPVLHNGETEFAFSQCFPWKDQNELFHYTWIDFGEGRGLRVHQLEWTNAWADLRSPHFFNRPICNPGDHDFNVGLSFSVQWWKDRPGDDHRRFGGSFPPPTLYDLYVDIGWRALIRPGWLLDLVLSPGLSTDFRVTPPDGFRFRGHAMTVVDITPNLSGVLGVWYLNRNTTKILPIAGLLWWATNATRVEAVFPRPRLVQELGTWKDRAWEVYVAGEYGGGGWAFKDHRNARETVDYNDLRAFAGISFTGKRSTAYLEAGYVFDRELDYARFHRFDYEPGNAFFMRVGWTY
jgi:hypothetical protein